MNSFAFLLLIASACATPIMHTLTKAGHMELHGLDDTRSIAVTAKPNYLETVSAFSPVAHKPILTKVHGKESYLLAVPKESSVRSGYFKVEPSKTEGLFDIKEAGSGLHESKTRSGYFKVEPTKTEGLFRVKTDAMQQSQQLEGKPRLESALLQGNPSIRSGWFKVKPSETEGLFRIESDAVVTKAKGEDEDEEEEEETKATVTSNISMLHMIRLPDGSMYVLLPIAEQSLVKSDAMQQSQQLGGNPHLGKSFIESNPTESSGWFKVKPGQTEGLFRIQGDAIVSKEAVFNPNIQVVRLPDGKLYAFLPISDESLTKIRAMHEQQRN